MLNIRYKLRKLVGRLYKLLQILSYTRKYNFDKRILDQLFLFFRHSEKKTTLDIGSGPTPKNPFGCENVYGADLRENPTNNVVFCDLSMGKLPFESEKFDFVTAFDVFEHIPRVISLDGKNSFPFILIMNEIFRVLKVGGILFAFQPVFPAKSAFQDPTHVNIMSEDTMDYYFCNKAWARIYGYDGSFEMLNDGWVGDKYFCFMRKSFNLPERNLTFKQS